MTRSNPSAGDRGRQDPGSDKSESEPRSRRVVDDHRFGGSHGQRLTDSLHAPGRTHRYQGHAALAGLGQLQAHLDAVAVGVVQHLLAGPDQPVGVRFEPVGRGRVRDLLGEHHDLHAGGS